MHQVDCLHREFREAVRAVDCAAERTGVAGVHAAVPPHAWDVRGASFNQRSGTRPYSERARGTSCGECGMLYDCGASCPNNAAAPPDSTHDFSPDARDNCPDGCTCNGSDTGNEPDSLFCKPAEEGKKTWVTCRESHHPAIRSVEVAHVVAHSPPPFGLVRRARI